ncbi:MAG: HD domain-containing protein [Ruminococcaceae bacterium]|nr:HD domain-containing protein [Oscillospiraceae bacterium]
MEYKMDATNDLFLMIRSMDKKTTAKGLPYLDFMFCDKEGEISGKLWDYHEELHGMFEVGDIVKVRGTVSQYNGTDQLRVERIRKTQPTDNVDPADFVPSAALSGEAMYDELIGIANGFKDDDIKRIVLAIYEGYADKLKYWPAAFKLHHAIRGGLLYHTLSIVRLAQSVCAIYPSVNSDLLIAGAMLHDIAKIDEFDVNDAGTATGYTLEGNLIGHLAKGAIVIDRFAEKVGTPDELKFLLQHMVLSHHGEPDFGAAVRPMFLEAELLSELDLMDARIYELEEAIGNAKAGDYTQRLWALDNRKFYNHGKQEVTTNANLV